MDEMAAAVAVVTGAGGLGRHFVTALADRGVPVAAVGRSTSAVDETVRIVSHAGRVAVAVYADVLEPGAAQRVISEVESSLGPVGVLINNAGTMNLGRVATIDPAAWWTDFEVNVKATMLWCQAALEFMLPRRNGVIVNIASTATQWVVPAGSAYIASKAAVISLTGILAAELDGTGCARSRSVPGLART